MTVLETSGPYGAKWVPEGADMPCFGRKGYQKARNIIPEGSKKVVWSASLACFTITHFSVAKAIFKKIQQYFPEVFYLLPANAGPDIAQARGENLRWFPPNLSQAENSAGAISSSKRIFASFPRPENNDENR